MTEAPMRDAPGTTAPSRTARKVWRETRKKKKRKEGLAAFISSFWLNKPKPPPPCREIPPRIQLAWAAIRRVESSGMR